MRFRKKSVTALIDVRSWLEFFFGHVPGAIRIPVGKVNRAELERRGITPDESILVYCASGSRSAMAAQALKREGYTRVIDGGGMANVQRHLEED